MASRCVIDYCLDGVPDTEPIYRLLTTILDHEKAPAQELAALYHERWEIETALDELKTHLRGAKTVLRSKTPDLVRGQKVPIIDLVMPIPQRRHHHSHRQPIPDCLTPSVHRGQLLRQISVRVDERKDAAFRHFQ